MSERGKFIVMEGGEFSGKTTQFGELQRHIARRGLTDKFVFTREPGGTPFGDTLRQAVFFPPEPISPAVQLSMFTGNRLHNCETKIEPALNAGYNVASDRHLTSSRAYQAAEGELDDEFIMNASRLYLPKWYLEPDLIVILDIPREVRIARRAMAALQDGKVDMFEQKDEDYMDEVYRIYRELSPKIGAKLVDGDRDKDVIAAEIAGYFDEVITA